MSKILRKINHGRLLPIAQMSTAFLLVFASTIQAQDGKSPVYTGSSIPGDYKMGVASLKRTYDYINIFRMKTGGDLPLKNEGLILDIIKNPKDYGFETPDMALEPLSNPDDKYNDSAFVRSDPSRKGFPGIYYIRPNGEKLGGVREKGTKDVFSFSNTYYHFNEPSETAGRPLANPVGFYLVLYDDGSIEKVAYDRQLYVIAPGGSRNSFTYTSAFPKQSGVPYHTLSYEEYWDVAFGGNKSLFPPLGYRTPKGNVLPIADDGQAEGLLNLLRQWQPNIERSQIWDALDKFGANNPSLSDLTSVTGQLGVSTQLQKLSLKELQQKGVPALAVLPDDGRMVTMLAVNSKFAIILDRGRTLITEIAKLQERLGSPQFEALVPTKALTQKHRYRRR